MKIYDVFISYRRTNEDVTKRKEGYGGSEIAEALYRYLTAKGLRVFYDKIEMPGGHYFWDSIADAIKVAPHYILVGSTDAFIYRDVDEENGERDYVKDEIELAVAEYEKNKIERTVTVIQTVGANIPEINTLPENVRNITKAQRKILQYGSDNPEVFYEIFKSVTNVNRRNLWFAAHRWLENSKLPGGRFASLNINESILPNSSKNKTEQKSMPINVYSKENVSENRQSLLDAMSCNGNHLYLIGQGGIGKTTSLMHIMNNAYVDKQYSENAQIPLFVELSFAPDTYGALYEGGKSSFIRRSIYKQVRADRTIKQVTAKEVSDVDEVFSTLPYDVAVQPITDILSKTTPAPEYLLLLDGLNEVSSVTVEETGLSVVQMIMREIDLLISECPNVRVVLTSRSDESAIYNESISRLYLSGVEDSTIKDYLESFELSKEQIDKVLEDENLNETLQIPLFLTMYASLSKYDEVSTQGEILKLFFNERRKNISIYTMQERLSQVEKNITDVASAVQKNRIDADMQNFILDFILPEIAWSLERNGEFYLSVRSIRKIVEPILTDTDDLAVCGEFGREIFSKYRNGASAKMHTYKVAKKIFERLGDDITEVTESIINCCVFALGVMQESNGKYGFVHQHIRDYFAALKNINTIRLSVYLYEENEKELALECMNKAFKDEPVNYTIRRFMGEYLGEHLNKPYYANDKWNYGVPAEKCDRNLIRRTLDIYRGYFNGEVGYGIYSLIQILKEIRDDLMGADLSRLDLKLCALNGHKLGEKGLVANFAGTIIERDVFFPNGHTDSILSMRFSLDGNFLLTTSKDRTAKLWDLKTGKCLRTFVGHEKAVNSGEFSIDEKCIVTASDDGKAIVWDVQTGEILHSFCGHCGALSSAYFSEDYRYVITVVLFRFIEIWETETEERVAILNGDAERINKAYLSKKGNKIIPCFMGPMKFSKIKIWDVENNCFDYPFENNTNIISAIAFSPQEEQLVYSLPDSTVFVQSMTDKSSYMLKELHTQRIVEIDYSANGDFFVTNSLDNIIRVFDSKTGECISSIKGIGKPYTSFSINNAGDRLSVAVGSNLYVYDLSSNKCIQSIKGTNQPIKNASFSQNGEIIAFSSNNILSFWSAISFKFLCSIKAKVDIKNFFFERNSEKKLIIELSDNNMMRCDIDAMSIKKMWNPSFHSLNSTYFIVDSFSSLVLTKEDDVLFVRKNGLLKSIIKNVYGIMMENVDLSGCDKKAFISEEDRLILSQYGVIF